MKRTIGLMIAIIISVSDCYKFEKYPLIMPNVRPNVEDLYLCTPVRINSTQSYYIVGFDPDASMNYVHHMLIYGCSQPGSSESVWNCGEMALSDDKGPAVVYNPCKEGSQVIYAWARDAPPLQLPEDVGFKVGGDSPIQYLVLQAHYSRIDKFKNGETDKSGVYLTYTEKPMPKLAGILLLGTMGEIAANKIVNMEVDCTIEEDKIMHPFAFRTHTHSLGKVVSGYLVRNNSGINQWTLLGKKDPMKPQMFYKVFEPQVTIKKGDKLAARCTMESFRPYKTYIGATNNDEMCNYYIMYYVDGDEPLDQKYCFTSGPPTYSWEKSGLNNIPLDASRLY